MTLAYRDALVALDGLGAGKVKHAQKFAGFCAHACIDEKPVKAGHRQRGEQTQYGQRDHQLDQGEGLWTKGRKVKSHNNHE